MLLSKDMKITTVVIGQSIPPKQIVLLTLPCFELEVNSSDRNHGHNSLSPTRPALAVSL